MYLLKVITGLDFSRVKKLLTSEPFNLKVKESLRHPSLYLVMYDMIKSDFKQPAVSNCRGIILEKDTNKIICWPFNKFWNHGESRAAKIDWSTALVFEKYDGSLMKIYNYKNEWIVSTNGTIDSRDTPARANTVEEDDNLTKLFDNKSFTFYDVFKECWKNTYAAANPEILPHQVPEFPFSELDPDYTYMLEAMHPANTVVVRYDKPQLRLLSARNIKTYMESLDPSIPHVPKAKVYNLNSLETCQTKIKSMTIPTSFEGFVVLDKNFNRIKMKSAAYVAAHHMRSRLIDPDAFLMMSILNGEISEVLVYLTEYEKRLTKLSSLFEEFIVKLTTLTLANYQKAIEPCDKKQRKQYAMLSKENHSIFPILMKLYDLVDADSIDSPNYAAHLALKIREHLRDNYSTTEQKSLCLAKLLVL